MSQERRNGGVGQGGRRMRDRPTPAVKTSGVFRKLLVPELALLLFLPDAFPKSRKRLRGQLPWLISENRKQ